MNIDFFHEFLILADCLNYRQAARKLFISQSALSRHMEALETELHTRLFARTTQSVSLTETGRLLQLRARTLMDDYEDIRQQMERIEAQNSRTLRVGIPFYSTEDYLETIPTEFAQAFPEIKTDYFVDTPTDVYKNLLNHKTDIAFLAGYEGNIPGTIACIPVYKERLGVVMISSNPLTKRSICCSLI